jgi:Lrp/AsnC family transcriptional regulator of ectoine degradation
MKLDAYDIKILAALQRDGRMTKLNLAKEIHLSPSPCWERLRRVEAHGLIQGYHAEIDIDRLTRISTVLVEVTLKSHHVQDFERFEIAVRAVPEIVECYATGGGFDYLLKVIATDIDHYQRLIDGLLSAHIGIERYFTYIVTKTVKRFTGYPVQQLLEPGEWPPQRNAKP